MKAMGYRHFRATSPLGFSSMEECSSSDCSKALADSQLAAGSILDTDNLNLLIFQQNKVSTFFLIVF